MPQKYFWPSSGLTESDMPLLYRARESSAKRTPITKLIAAAVQQQYGHLIHQNPNERNTTMQNQDIMNVLSRSGVLLNVSIRFWRASKKLKAEDLGLDPDTVTNHLISLGHKKLVPREALKSLCPTAWLRYDSRRLSCVTKCWKACPTARPRAYTKRH
jgi:hypothetical protein